jgi:hypothetical protein
VKINVARLAHSNHSQPKSENSSVKPYGQHCERKREGLIAHQLALADASISALVNARFVKVAWNNSPSVYRKANR